MARKSFTFKRSTAGSVGSYLQAEPAVLGVDDDSALRGDNYTTTPSEDIFGGAELVFEASPSGYDSVSLRWETTSQFANVLTTVPQATRLLIVYGTSGVPQTVSDGTILLSPTSVVGSFEHFGLMPGRWAYYSLFVQYESTTLRSWYELIGTVETLVPVNHNSTLDLWRRIPLHYRKQDQLLTEDPDDESLRGPLYRVLDVFGWDIDRLRTLIDFQMVSKDPELSEVEVLNALAYELGTPLTVEDLGPSRLRNLLRNVRINNSIKGTIAGVQQTLSAVTGSLVEITAARPQYLSSVQQAFAGGVVTTLPTVNAWGYEAVTAVTCAASAGGCAAARSSGSGYRMTVLSTPVPVVQSARYRTFYDAVSSSGASVAGAYMSATRQSNAGWTFDTATGSIDGGPDGWDQKLSDGTDWFQVPHDHGIVGNGTFSNATVWFHLVIVFGPGPSSIMIKNPSVVSLDMYPYTIDIYSERVNLIKDPQFAYQPSINTLSASGGFWNVYTNSGVLTGSSITSPIEDPSLTELIDDAVLWIDAGSDGGVASVAVANGTLTVTPKFAYVPVTVNTNMTGNLTPIRVGVEYSFSVIDRGLDIQTVSVKSRTYGTIVTATAPYREIMTLDGTRRYWLLYREYEAPWLPENLQDCYIELVANANAVIGFTMKQPLFEPFLRNGAYFDGENINGGWLRGSNYNGAADYRWGTGGENQSFSYYATDYARTVSAVQRLLPFILPVTETNATLRFNRVLGYLGSDMP